MTRSHSVDAKSKRADVPLLVHSGCCNKIAQAGWLLNNRNVFLKGWEAVKSKIKSPAWSSSGEGPLPGS